MPSASSRFQSALYAALVAMASVPLAYLAAIAAPEKETDDPAMAALQQIQEIVGDWEGSGTSETSKGFEEAIHSQWKFSKEDGASLSLAFADKGKPSPGRLLKEINISYDSGKKAYLLKATLAGAEKSEPLEFEGNKKKGTANTLEFTRVNKRADDKLDKIDLLILNEGDRISYQVHRRVGKSKVFRQVARVALDRKGTSLAGGAAKGPKCIITGGPGTMPVSYNGATYYVCCTGCRDAFLAEPEKYLAKLDK